MDVLWDLWQQHRGKILGAILGFLAGVLILVFGFIKAIFLISCVFIGYYIGKHLDKGESLRDILDKILPPGK
ncbi:DUF2273 domain-containing protein [Thermosediminibacter oceani]|uniref:Small integral membrane protein n=1 Tax=Thermosediminibacter oceani (strain ATCC BAA-1034 / DSM 16646 / JW/IW-1228P) TaxID=555079 RepID=D9S3U0_THEOJ|nr:DUF2273 domain-containing protein [Thermosediminibacter oceani]ADL08067.1 Protein of unknown function DUF2273 [Thermosediminibacter oceani DSM 16646]